MKQVCLEQAIATSTARAYRHDLDAFWRWAAVRRLAAKPRYPIPITWIMDYVRGNLSGFAPSTVRALNAKGPRVTGAPLSIVTLRRRLAALSVEHSLRGVPNPCRDPALHLYLRRVARLKPRRSGHRHLPITAEVLTRLLKVCGEDLRGLRDKALLLVGFSGGGRRRSELAALAVEDLDPVAGGYLARLKEHKTAWPSPSPSPS